jgi:hypothetical protein
VYIGTPLGGNSLTRLNSRQAFVGLELDFDDELSTWTVYLSFLILRIMPSSYYLRINDYTDVLEI